MDCEAALPHAHRPHLCLRLPYSRALLTRGTLSCSRLGPSITTEVLRHPRCHQNASRQRRGKQGQHRAPAPGASPGGEHSDRLLTRAAWGPALQTVNALTGTHPKSSAPRIAGVLENLAPRVQTPRSRTLQKNTRSNIYSLSHTHCIYIISTTARGEIYINDPLSFFLLKAAGYRIWQPGNWWYSSHSRSKGEAAAPHAVPSPGLCPVADQAHFYSSLRRDESNL